ncbi:MAG: tRNA (adenine-N1)-methyltransferase [Acidimicrobiia bacterium]
MSQGQVFRAGESCLLFDVKKRQHLISLDPKLTFQFDKGVVPHSDIIGAAEGSTLLSSKDSPVVVVRPRLADYVLNMKRGAAVMYPKDVASILVWADIAPGNTVLEAGTGSGALTLALARAVGESGRVVSFDVREDHQAHAQKLMAAFGGTIPDNIELRAGTVEEHVSTVSADRVILDLPEPWATVPGAASALVGGGVFACYLPTIPQVQRVRGALDQSNVFFDIDTFEVLMRSWAVDGQSVRPEHRMVGHTGFITTARKRIPRPNI